MRNHHHQIAALAALAGLAIIASSAASCGGSGGTTSESGTQSSGPGGPGGPGGSGGGGSGGTSTGGNGGNGGTGNVPMGCMGDNDCIGDPGGTVCDPATQKCVGCLPSNDMCPDGQFCDPNTQKCTTGCANDADCATDPNGYLYCEVASKTCVGCLLDDHCDPGLVCSAIDGNICVPGCTPTHPCAAGFNCCTDQCFDLTSSFDHCGGCDSGCTNPQNATVECVNSMCGAPMCNQNYADCNGDPADGCEHNILQDDACACVPGSTQPCYQGAPGTQNVGPCKGGVRTCLPSGTGYGPCLGQVLPKAEICANNIDENCDNIMDNVTDADGDGWTICNGDCNDSNPLVNPGAFDAPNNGIDDDCNAATSDIPPNPYVGCSSVAKFAEGAVQAAQFVTGSDLASAMDICQTTTANPPLAQKKWGLISASLLNANGAVANAQDLGAKQTAVLQNYGAAANNPRKGATMVGLSTGKMRDKADPGYVIPVTGTALTSQINFAGAGAPLGTYLAAHGGTIVPGTCAGAPCPGPIVPIANDSVNLKLVIRVPTNAQSFSYDFKFYTGEYQSFQCDGYNDYYLAMLQTGAAGIPNDHNISFDALNKPVSVNNGFFQVCGGNGMNCNACPSGTGPLAGTGMDDVAGGGTDWLTTDAPIVPGETMTLELVIFDVGDHIYDSNILIDNFRWALSPAMLGTHE